MVLEGGLAVRQHPRPDQLTCVELMKPLSQVAAGGDSSDRPSAAELLADASQYHLGEAQDLAQEAARHLAALAQVVGISPEQARRLQSLAGCAATAAEGAGRIGQELGANGAH